MNLYGFLRAVTREWWVIVLMATIGSAAGFGIVQASGDSFAVTNRIFVKVLSGESASDLSAGAVFTNQQVELYPVIVTSRETLQDVIDDLDLDMTTQELSKWVSAEVPAETPVVAVTVTSPDSETSVEVADRLAEVAGAQIEELESRPGSNRSPVEAVVLHSAADEAEDVSIPLLEGVIGGGIVGAGLGLATTILLYVRSQLQAEWDKTYHEQG